LTGPLLGIPYSIWGVVCLAFSALWAVFWPADRAASTSGLRRLVLRWGHALCWLLLAAAAFALATGPGGLSAAGVLGLAALASYLAFVYALVTTRN